jgi:glucan-binding YG repeat protein
MGLVNLGLLILFVVAIYKIVTMWKSKTDLSRSLNIDSPAKKEIVQEMDMQGVERKALEREENKATKFEIKTIKDIEESLVEMIRIIQTSNANLNSQDRGRISETLKKISSKEDIFLKTIQNLKQLLQRLRVLDAKQIQEMKNRLARSNGKEKEALEKEIFMEVEKIKIEQNVIALEQKLEQGMSYFNNLLRQAVQVLNSTAYPADAIQHLSQARMGLKDTFSIIDEMRRFEDKLIQLTKNEKRLLKDEKNKA